MSTHNIFFHRGDSNEYPQHKFLWRTEENYPSIIIIFCVRDKYHLLPLNLVSRLGRDVTSDSLTLLKTLRLLEID